MSKKNEILNLLTQNELTVKELSNSLGYGENEIRVYINRLVKENKIKSIGKKELFKIYKAISNEIIESESIDTEILKKLIIPFARSGIEIDLSNEEIKRIKQLMEMIK